MYYGIRFQDQKRLNVLSCFTNYVYVSGIDCQNRFILQEHLCYPFRLKGRRPYLLQKRLERINGILINGKEHHFMAFLGNPIEARALSNYFKKRQECFSWNYSDETWMLTEGKENNIEIVSISYDSLDGEFWEISMEKARNWRPATLTNQQTILE